MNESIQSARNKAENLTSIAGEKIKDQYHDVKDRLGEVADRAKTYANDLTHAIEKRPMYSVLAAAGIGIVVGMFLRRK